MKTLNQFLFFNIIFVLILASVCPGQVVNSPEKYSRVKIYVNSTADIGILQQNDITVEHYTGKLSDGIVLTLNQEEITRIQNTGLNYEIQIQDLDSYFLNRGSPSELELTDSKMTMINDNVSGFTYGSMGGYFTYAEVVRKLDSMRLLYPNLITAKQNIGTSVEGRTIWAVKISDNPDINESATEPAVYFDALHHAREPQSMASLMYFMYWLLENYQTGSEAAYLLNNREIFFVPVVNPDGYVYNQTTNPNGGGFWRKNRRNSGGGDFGVDLNRNYPYGWGMNSGSSSDPGSETYRGPSAASEPETQAIINFLQQIHPKIAFSMHSVAGRYLNPYGYNDSTVKYEVYSEYSSDFASTNNYLYGTVKEMLDYYSSGTTRDYLHSQGTYCWTPEVGGSDFWPLIPEIIPVASENLFALKYLSWVGGGFADYRNFKLIGKGYVETNDTLQLEITIKNRGLSQNVTNAEVIVIPLYQHISPNALTYHFSSQSIAPGQSASTLPLNFFTSSLATYMDEMKFAVQVNQDGIITSADTFRINIGNPQILFSDNAENGISRWTRAGTGLLADTTFIDPYDGSKNFADSRYGNSRNSSNNTITLIDTINLSQTQNPKIEFAAKWATEETFDYIRLQISTNFGTSWINLPGRYTRTVSGQPSYTGIKHWVNEQINLNPYIGQRIRIRFNLITDAGVPGDGFYFDNFRVVNYRDTGTAISSNETSIPTEFKLFQNYPNPFNPETVIRYSLIENRFVTLKIFDVLGNEIATLVNEEQNAGIYNYQLSTVNYQLSSGIYYYKLEAGSFSEVRKMIVLK